jgi:predicted ATPase/DNA-binding SARP family transcriptional activator
MEAIALHVLGIPTIERNGLTVETVKGKPLALVVYLAITGEPCARTALVDLLWPGGDAAHGMASLRSALWRLGRIFGEDFLEADRATVRLPAHSEMRVDARRFVDLLGPAAGAVPSLLEAVALYRGPFLEGFTLPDCPSFDTWQTQQEEHFRRRLSVALARLAGTLAAAGTYEEALALAARRLALDPLDEEAHRDLMKIHALAGQRVEALRRYEACVSVLAAELGVAPGDETRRLYDAIKRGEGPRAATDPVSHVALPAAPPRSSLPPATTPIVGRSAEIAQIFDRLEDPACRMITISGPGGVGKTCLALEAARRGSGLFDLSVFVNLSSVGQPELLLPTISIALGLHTGETESSETRLFAHVGNRRALVVLDSFEHLLPSAARLSRLLARAPLLKLLVTSRERLHLLGEWELALDGLPFPKEGEDVRANWEAVDLFIQTAARADRTFEPTPENRVAIAQICRLVAGMPLGVELAAGWVRHLSPSDLARQMASDLDFLAGPRDAPERQRSLRATFAHSWNLLGEVERGVLCRLSVFRGGASPEVAVQVAGASLGSLASLVDRFLLRRTATNRYELHPLIRQFTAEALRALPGELEATQDRHAEHYTSVLARSLPTLEGPLQEATLGALDAEIDDVRAAFTFSVEHARVKYLSRALDGFCAMHELRGRHEELAAVLAVAASVFRGAGDEQSARLLGRVLARRGEALLELSRHNEAAAQIEEGLALLREHAADSEMGVALRAVGRLALHHARLPDAGMHFRAGLLLAKTLGDRRAAAVAMADLAIVEARTGDILKAESLLRKSLAAFRALGSSREAASRLCDLGDLFLHQGDAERAEAAYREGLEDLDPAGALSTRVLLLSRLAGVLLLRGSAETAVQHYEECRRGGESLGQTETVAAALQGLGVAALRGGDLPRARRFLDESLGLRRRAGVRPGVAASYLALAELALTERSAERARSCLETALLVASEVSAPTLALRALVGLFALLPPDRRVSSVERALREVAVHPDADAATRAQAANLAAVELLQPRPGVPPPPVSTIVASVLEDEEKDNAVP